MYEEIYVDKGFLFSTNETHRENIMIFLKEILENYEGDFKPIYAIYENKFLNITERIYRIFAFTDNKLIEVIKNEIAGDYSEIEREEIKEILDEMEIIEEEMHKEAKFYRELFKEKLRGLFLVELEKNEKEENYEEEITEESEQEVIKSEFKIRKKIF